MIKALAPCAALVLVIGCTNERIYEDTAGLSVPSDFSNYAEDGVRPVLGSLTGDIGPAMRGIDEPAMLNGYHDSTFTSLEVIATNERGSAMTMLDFHGGVGHEQLTPGTRLTFDGSETSDPDDVYVTGVACSGDDQPYDWSYDEPLDSVEVQVQETGNPEVRRLNFTTIDMRGDRASGTVDVLVPERG